MGIKTFLVEPIYSEEDDPGYSSHENWPPLKLIARFRRVDTGEEKQNWHEFGPGAMISAVWYPKNMDWDNETEPHLMVICPNGHVWDIDSRCNNCGSPADRLHRCWIRSGNPPVVTVSKAGNSCTAGAGSILFADYHGHLTNGEFNP